MASASADERPSWPRLTIEEAARRLQRRFRAKQKEELEDRKRQRQSIFGSLESIKPKLRGKKVWAPDDQFRTVLANGVLEGWEASYIRFSDVEEAIYRQHCELQDSDVPCTSLNSSGEMTEPLLLEDGGEVECVVAFKEELGRVDAQCLAHVEEIVTTVARIREEACPKNTNLGSGTGTERLAMEMLHDGRIKGIKQAIQNIYKRTFIMLQASSLNYVAARKLQIRTNDALGPSLAKAAGVPSREEIRRRPFFLQLEDSSPPSTENFLGAIDEMERIYAHLFADGDVGKARGKLRRFRYAPSSKSQIFRLGFKSGMIAILLMWVAWLSYLTPPTDLECPFCAEYLLATLPAFRILVVPTAGLWVWSMCVVYWRRYNINYSYVLGVNNLGRKQLPSLANHQAAATAMLLLLLVFVLYLGAIRTGTYVTVYGFVKPTLYPVMMLAAVFVLSVWPWGTNNLPSHFWGSIGRMALRPFGPEVSFKENLVADVLTSMVVVLRDVASVIGFYYCGGASGLPDRELPALLVAVQGPLITAIPYWWRFMQCIRRAYDGRGAHLWIPQLVNAFKYLLSLLTITMAALGCTHGCSHFYLDKEKWTAGRITWFTCLVLGTCVSYVWDVVMDWSLLERVPGGATWCFGLLPAIRLREKRALPATWFYYWAPASNLVGRLMWAISINPSINGASVLTIPQVMGTVVAVVEMLRRGQWALLRVENEFLSNASHYRSVSDVPFLITFAEMSLGKRKFQAVTSADSSTKTRNRAKEVLLGVVSVAVAAGAVFVVFKEGSIEST